jgi:hypothetical protein
MRIFYLQACCLPCRGPTHTRLEVHQLVFPRNSAPSFTFAYLPCFSYHSIMICLATDMGGYESLSGESADLGIVASLHLTHPTITMVNCPLLAIYSASG